LARREKRLLKYLASAICFVLGVLLILDSKSHDSERQGGVQQVVPGQEISGGRPEIGNSTPTNLSVPDSTLGAKEEFIRSRAGELCRSVLDSCTAKIAFVSEDCNEEAATVEMNQLLEKPLKNLHCQEIYSRLEAECPSGCRLDSSHAIVLPGSIQFFLDDESSNDSGCQVTGERQVNIRANCVGEG